MMRFAVQLLALAFVLGACETASLQSPSTQTAPPNISCEDYKDLLALEAEYGGVFLGELHGTLNSAEIISCFVLTERQNGRRLVLSFEGSLSGFDKRSFHEAGRGGSGVGTPALISVIERVLANPALGVVRFHDQIEPPFSNAYANLLAKSVSAWTEADIELFTAERERAIARNIIDQHEDDTFIVALGGNLHAATAEIVPQIPLPAGSLLPENIASVLLTSSVGGQAFNCSPDCALRDVPPAPLVLAHDSRLGKGVDQPKDAPRLTAYDYVFDLGKLRSITPPQPPS